MAEVLNDDLESEYLPLDTELELFRSKWHAEIQERKPQSTLSGSNNSRPSTPNKDDIYLKARELFLNGVWAEQHGFMHEAIDYYRTATKMVPDIEMKVASSTQHGHPVLLKDTEPAAEDDDEINDLCQHFSELMEHRSQHCFVDTPQSSAHISDLPLEILTYILRWIISSDLDSRSLEQFSMVCRGFYLLARDPKLWQNICRRIWGIGCTSYLPYASWRLMAIQRPHILFNGAYISKVEFMRKGEATIDKVYPLWQKVTYYRYFRFFPNGLVFMHLSAGNPVVVVGQLRSPTAQVEGMCKGMYRVKDNQISCILKRIKLKEAKVYQKETKPCSRQAG